MDVVAGDFNGAAWRRDNSNSISIIEEAFADCALPMPPGPTPLCGPGAVPGKWADVYGFLNSPDFDGQWKVRQHGAFSIPHEALGIRPTDQSCHHEVCLHLGFVERRSVSITSGETRSTDSLERTFCAVPLQQTEGSHKRGCRRPFAFFVIGRPFAASSDSALPTT